MNTHEHIGKSFYIQPPGFHAERIRQAEEREKRERDENILSEKVMRETGCALREFWNPNLSVRDRQIIAGLLVINRIDLATKFLKDPKSFREQHQPLIKKAMSLLNNSVNKDSIPAEVWENVASDDA